MIRRDVPCMIHGPDFESRRLKVALSGRGRTGSADSWNRLCSASPRYAVGDFIIITALYPGLWRTHLFTSSEGNLRQWPATADVKHKALSHSADTTIMDQTNTMDSRRNEVLAVAILFFFLSWLTVSLRFYVRGKLMHTWGLDDT